MKLADTYCGKTILERGGDILAFASMMIILLVIILLAFILLLGMLFVAGLVFLIIGIVKKQSPKNKGKKHPVVFIVVGSLLALPAVVSIAIVLVKVIISIAA